MSDDLHRMMGEANGKLDSILRWQQEHNERHEKIDAKLDEHAADINQAKGAKKALFTTAAAISGLVAIAAAAADKLLK